LFFPSFRDTEERPGWCTDPHLPPCAAYANMIKPISNLLYYWNDWASFFYTLKIHFVLGFNVSYIKYFMNRFVEIMATVFSRDAWRCVWHMIQVKRVNLNFLPIPLL